MWDQRYSQAEFAYGTKPNEFLEANFSHLPKGKVLSIAEGEGRNAIFLAKQGYQVTAVDASLVGLEKAKKFAKEEGVEIEFIHADLRDFDLGENKWEGIVSIFCPLPSEIRKNLYNSLELSLKPSGVFLIEAYRPEQLSYGTGGGNSLDVMQNKETLVQELPNLKFTHLVELQREVIEGTFHTGMGAVVQAIGVKEI